MKRLATVFALALLLSFLLLTSTVHAQSNQIIPGTQVRLTLINGLSSSVARVVAAAKFVRDVRDGMAEYRDLHPRGDTPAPPETTGSSESQQSRRET